MPLGIALAGAALRAALAVASFPVTGDPVFSYVYRALLIAEGHLEGVKLMWHPPGLPVLIAAIYRLVGRVVSPYVVGVLLAILASVALTMLINHLLSRAGMPLSVRLISATTLACYEIAYLTASAPLTEPIYLALVWLGILFLAREPCRAVDGLFAGLALGAGTTVRMEGLVVLLGLGLWSLVQPQQRSLRAGFSFGLAFALGAVMTAGWFLADLDYLRTIVVSQQPGSTVPVVTGLAPNIRRAVDCVYHAATVWIPQTVFLPFVALAFLGLVESLKNPKIRRLSHLIFVAAAINSVAVIATIMHKRTGAFLIPAVAVWTAVGVHHVAFSIPATMRWLRQAVWAGAALLIATQLVRIPVDLGYVVRQPVTRVQGDLLSNREIGPVWAFGGEPEVYAFAGWPIVYDFFGREASYGGVCEALDRGIPDFVSALRQHGYRYLTFAMPYQAATSVGSARQPYGGFACEPGLGDAERLIIDARNLGLQLLATSTAANSRERVALLAVMPTEAAGQRMGDQP